MGRTLSPAEIEVLSAEAERRVRAGEPRSEVAAVLGLPRSTLADWAQKGRWRQKDLFEERAADLARQAVERIAALRQHEAEAAQLKEAKAADLMRRMQAILARSSSAGDVTDSAGSGDSSDSDDSGAGAGKATTTIFCSPPPWEAPDLEPWPYRARPPKQI